MAKPKRRREIVLPSEARGAEHVFFSDLAATVGVGPSSGKLKIPKVLCVIPEKDSDGTRTIHFFPTVQQAKRLQMSFLVSVKGTYSSGNGRYRIEADEVWCKGITQTSWQNFVGYSGLTGKPQTLKVTHLFEGKSKSNAIERGSFKISEAPVVNAAAIISRSYTGNIRVRRISTPTFTLASGIKISFVRHYAHKNMGDTISTSSELSAEFKTVRSISQAKFKEVEDDFNDFLLLISLASRYRCSLYGWQYSAGKKLEVQEYFNRIQPGSDIPNTNQTLIDISVFPAFIRKAYREYRRLPNKELVERSIQALTAERSFLEDRYTSLFAGLQSILWFSYRSSGGSERRMPIKKLFSEFMTSRSVQLDDLWPLFDEQGGASLYTIRNAIAHGEYISPQKMLAMSYALENLNWTLERAILCVLGWPLDKTKVRPQSLRFWTAAINWKKERLNW